MEAGATEPVITDVPGESRYEIRLGDELVGFAAYKRRPGEITFTHTEINPSFEGRGLAGRLIGAALDAAREEKLAVRPVCPYVRAYIEGHPAYEGLVSSNFS
jgi:predicted GNAT family acetyltransferase